MKNPGDFTTTDETAGPEDQRTTDFVCLGFVVFWCPEQPTRTGAFIPVVSDATGRPQIMGRGGQLPTDEYPRLEAQRQRPGANLPLGPFESPALSRVQLHVTSTTAGTLELVNVGKCALLVNGAPSQRAQVRPGDLVELGRQLTLLCVERPLRLKGAAGLEQDGFGEPDQYGIVGESPSVWELRSTIAAIGAREGHVLILGGSGTGKELIARAVHRESKVRGPFVARNAGTLPESLIDAELFGSAKGYPNAGMPERPGLIGAAHGGSLFLDEIAELPIAAQTHLLRVLDAGEYQRLGETTTRRSEFRLIAATNQPENALRPDVHARFTFRIQAADLARRREDTALLARYLLKKMAREDETVAARYFTEEGEPRLGASFVRGLASHPFPNNVRELRNLLWQAAIAGEGPALEWQDTQRRSAAETEAGDNPTADSPLNSGALQDALDRHNGSIDKTWRALGLANRFALMRLVKKHGLEIRKASTRR